MRSRFVRQRKNPACTKGGGRARPVRIPGARRRRFRHSVSHVGGRRCASCARRKRKQLSRYAQAPLQAEALQSAANTRKHKNCSEKTEDGSKLCFLRWICQTQRGRQMQSQTLIGQSSPVDLPTPAGLSNAVAMRQPLPSGISSMHLRRTAGPTNAVARWNLSPGSGVSSANLQPPAGLSNAAAKWNFSPGSGVSSANLQTPTGLSNAAARWNLSPGGEDFSVHLPRTAGSSNTVARRQPSPSGVPRWIYQTLQDCRIQLRGGKPCWAEVPRCICESQRDRQMQPPGGTSRQAAESPR